MAYYHIWKRTALSRKINKWWDIWWGVWLFWVCCYLILWLMWNSSRYLCKYLRHSLMLRFNLLLHEVRVEGHPVLRAWRFYFLSLPYIRIIMWFSFHINMQWWGLFPCSIAENPNVLPSYLVLKNLWTHTGLSIDSSSGAHHLNSIN